MRNLLWAGLVLSMGLWAGCMSHYERDNDYSKLITPGNIPVVPQNEASLPYTSLPNNGEGSYV